ncbi:flagellar protein FlaG [Pleionea sediminis]|uniref:flagellar protein FlaG n=1 Tax=Pleionea sediminis TaxID=2569479 RepID=UPI0013DDE660|nr:flagellar protein FlaG [Pleionea sediminis]
MAINPLSDNFQSLDISGGKKLPPKSQSTAVSLDTNPAKVDLSKVDPKISQDNVKAEEQEKQSKDGIGAQEVQQQLEKFAQATSSIQRSLRFQVDDNTGDTIIKVFDRKTDELIRQIPPEELLTLSKRLKELNDTSSPSSSGVLLRKEV